MRLGKELRGLLPVVVTIATIALTNRGAGVAQAQGNVRRNDLGTQSRGLATPPAPIRRGNNVNPSNVGFVPGPDVPSVDRDFGWTDMKSAWGYPYYGYIKWGPAYYGFSPAFPYQGYGRLYPYYAYVTGVYLYP